MLEPMSMIRDQLLEQRGIITEKQREEFVNPVWEHYHDPFLMHNMGTLVERLKHAIDNREVITIYADYDADGIPGAAILASFFDIVSHDNYDIYLPHRHDEGYGIHIDALKKIKAKGTNLVITIDVGITAHDAVKWSKDNEMELIITDHHEAINDKAGKEWLPDALIVNPKQSACSYPDPMLCGSGVIFKVIQAFLSKYREIYKVHEGWEKWLLDLVGLATISDMVPLLDENRLFAWYGMKVLAKTRRKGLHTLMIKSGINPYYMTEDDLAFSMTPKINAASRMSHPEDALALLRASDEASARESYTHLEKLNTERKKIVAQNMKQVHSELNQRKDAEIIVIGHPDWHLGILGLVASKITEHYQVPSFVWTIEGGEVKGSCRSLPGIDLVALMNTLPSGTFTQFGGHEGAGGFSCSKEAVHTLSSLLIEALPRIKKNEKEVDRASKADLHLSLSQVTINTYREIRELAPFGIGNSKPLFQFNHVHIDEINMFGKEKNHLRITVSHEGTRRDGIAFFKTSSDFSKALEVGTTVTVLAHIELSVFRGVKELRLRILDCI